MIINDSTRLIDLTVGELKALFADIIPQQKPVEETEYVKGLDGLCELLGCKKSKANKLKASGRLDGCYIQEGRTILFIKNKVLKTLNYGRIN